MNMKSTILTAFMFVGILTCAAQSYISDNALTSKSRYKNSTTHIYHLSPTGMVSNPVMLSSSYSSPIQSPQSYSSSPIYNGSHGSRIYKPFSNETPVSISIRRSGEDNDDDDDWNYGGGGTGGNAGDPEENKFTPIGESWCLAVFALLFMLVIKKRKHLTSNF